MLLSELQGVAARFVPGTGVVAIERLGNGLVNESYRVLRDGAAYALRVAVANPCDLGLDREWELRVLEAAARAGLAPAVEYHDQGRGILISRWIDGRCWSQLEVASLNHIRDIADLAHRIHALPVPAPARRMSPAIWIAYYRAALARTGAASMRHPTSSGAGLLQGAAARLARLEELPGAAPVLCHSDLHAQNLLDSDRSLVLLDWEYAHLSDPLWDLAGWSANNDFEDEARRELVTCYLGCAPNTDEWARLGLLCWLFDYVCLLWSELYLRLHGARSVEAVANRVQLLDERLHASLK